jgi:hypothetical protein
MTARMSGAKEVAISVPPGFGKPVAEHLVGEWWHYYFPDLGLSIDLPSPTLTPVVRKMPPREADRVTQAVGYSGRAANESFRLGAFWERPPAEVDPEAVARFNLSTPGENGYEFGEPTFKREKIDGVPACESQVSYSRGSFRGGIKSFYFLRSNAVYHFELWFWNETGSAAARDCARIVRSIHLSPTG